MRGLAYNQIQNGSSHTHKKRCSPLPHGQHLFFIPICYLLPYSFLKNAYPARFCPSIYCPIVFYPLPITHLRNKSTGIIVTASSTTAIQPIKLNGTQLNIFPIHSNTGIGINAAFTIAACTVIPYIKAVKQCADNKQYKIACQMLFFGIEHIIVLCKERMF